MSKGTDGSERGLERTFLNIFIIFISLIILATLATINPSPFVAPPRAYLEVAFAILVMGTFGAIYAELSKRVKSRKVNTSLRLPREFFIWGASLTFSGLMTTFSSMMANVIINFINLTEVANSFRDITNFYVQISLNFLIGGVTLIGASFPLLPSLFGQSEGEAASSSQSSGESGGSQQSK